MAKPFTDYDEDYDLLTGVNLREIFEISKQADPAMLTSDGGHIVDISTSPVGNVDENVPSALAALTTGGPAGPSRTKGTR